MWGLMQIVHGMGEHGGRYLGVIDALTSFGPDRTKRGAVTSRMILTPLDDTRCSMRLTAMKSLQICLTEYLGC